MPDATDDKTQDGPPLGVALIGCGGMATNYRDSYAGIAGTAYRLVVDINEETARTTAQAVGAERFSTDWRDALAPDIHLADVSTPNHLHTEQAVTLLGAGKHILLQKPLAPSVGECREIVQAAQRANRLAGVYMSDLEDPLVWDLKDMAQNGHLGRITGVRARYAHRGGLSAKPVETGNWRGSAALTGGGSFIQLSLHHTNLLGWILNDQIESVMAYAQNLACPNIGGDDMAVCVCRFARTGVLGVFESSWNADGDSVEIYGTGGRAMFRGGQGGPGEASLETPFAGRIVNAPVTNEITPWERSGTMRAHCRPENPLNQHRAFVQAVLSGAQSAPVPADAGLQDVAVAKAVYLSAETGWRVVIAEVLDRT